MISAPSSRSASNRPTPAMPISQAICRARSASASPRSCSRRGMRRPAWSQTSRNGDVPAARCSITTASSSGAKSATSAGVIASLPLQTACVAHDFYSGPAGFALLYDDPQERRKSDMPVLTIRHKTEYCYAKPVSFGEHRVMLRPRDGHDLRVLDLRMTIDPEPISLRWIHDVFGNSVGIAKFEGQSDRLVFQSEATIDHDPTHGIDLPHDDEE